MPCKDCLPQHDQGFKEGYQAAMAFLRNEVENFKMEMKARCDREEFGAVKVNYGAQVEANRRVIKRIDLLTGGGMAESYRKLIEKTARSPDYHETARGWQEVVNALGRETISKLLDHANPENGADSNNAGGPSDPRE